MSIQKIVSALAIATVMGISGTAIAEPNDHPIKTGVPYDGMKMELIVADTSVHSEALDPAIFGEDAPGFNTADFEETKYTDDRV